MPRNAKILAISMIVLFTGYAVFFAIEDLIFRLMVGALGLIGIFYIILKVPVTEDYNNE